MVTKLKLAGEIVEINGERFCLGRETKTGALTLKPIDTVKHDKQVERLTKKLAKHISREEVMRQALGEMSPANLTKIEAKLRQKTRVKKKQGCIKLDIGGTDVYVRGG